MSTRSREASAIGRVRDCPRNKFLVAAEECRIDNVLLLQGIAGGVVGEAEVLTVAVVEGVVAGEGDVEQHAEGQLPLETEGVLIRARRLVVQRIAGGALPDVGQQTGRSAGRGGQPARERIHQRIGSGGRAALALAVAEARNPSEGLDSPQAALSDG